MRYELPEIKRSKPLLYNAIISITHGIEDLENDDETRAYSALRNYYAGLILLTKQTIAHKHQEYNEDYILAKKYTPKIDKNGNIYYDKVGKETISFNEIAQRMKNIGIKISTESIKNLNSIRNDNEHLFTEANPSHIKELIYKSYPIIIDLCNAINENPAHIFGKTWDKIITESKHFKKKEGEFQKSFQNIEWKYKQIGSLKKRCLICNSSMIKQINPENTDQSNIETECYGCGSKTDGNKFLLHHILLNYDIDTTTREKEGIPFGPVYSCPECQEYAFLDFTMACASCDHRFNPQQCTACGTDIEILDIIDGYEDDLCPSCRYSYDKSMK